MREIVSNGDTFEFAKIVEEELYDLSSADSVYSTLLHVMLCTEMLLCWLRCPFHLILFLWKQTQIQTHKLFLSLFALSDRSGIQSNRNDQNAGWLRDGYQFQIWSVDTV